MAIAITGADGQLGLELCQQLGPRALPLKRSQFDLTNPSQMRKVLRELRPEAVINCAAYTLVDKAETERDQAHQINATAVGTLVEVCAELSRPLVQISTDYVFGVGSSAGPHDEHAAIHPQGVYAQTKAAGEIEAARWEQHIIVRTCGLYGHAPEKPNFVKTMLRLGRERSQLKIVSDQQCTPTYVAHLAQAVQYLLDSSTWGLYHVVNQGQTTWYEFASEIFKQANIEIELLPITTEEYNAPAPRPRDSRLDTSKYQSLGGPALPHWRDALTEYLGKISH
jgi:dTDP-4-dehydrorhamnose reductase